MISPLAFIVFAAIPALPEPSFDEAQPSSEVRAEEGPSTSAEGEPAALEEGTEGAVSPQPQAVYPEDPLPLVSDKEVAGWRAAEAEDNTDPLGDTAVAPETSVPKVWVARSEEASKRGRRAAKRRKGPPEKSAAFLLGYRHFSTKDALARDQAWHVASLEVTPLRRYVRLNLVTEFGFEGGPSSEKGEIPDFFVMQKGGVGVQYPHYVTPFVEFQGGAGLARTEMFDRNDLVMMWSLGVDAGAQWAIAKTLYIHAALGWVRPTFRRPAESVYFDRLTFKVGFGF